MADRTSPNSPSNSLTRYASGSVRQALAERLALAEAIEHVGILLAAFPNGGAQASRGYIGALASVLCDYPRIIALKCADPRQGVARETRFLPTVADVVAYCDREKRSLQEIVDRDDYNNALARERQQRAQHDAAQTEERKSRPTLQQMQERYGDRWGIGQGDSVKGEAERSANAAELRQASQRTVLREYEAAGMEPIVSPDGTLVSLELARYAKGVKDEHISTRARQAAEAAE